MTIQCTEGEHRTIDHQWEFLRTMLPPEAELERMARETGALKRKREVDSASSLLRLVLSYGMCDQSLRGTAAWARANGTATLSDVAVLKRLRKAGPWLERLLAFILTNRLQVESPVPGLRLRLIDGSGLNIPGCTGSAWRLHASYEPWSAKLQSVEVTDCRVGEHLKLYSLLPGEIAVVDRGYAHREGLASVVKQGAQFIVRLNWQNMPLETPEGETFDLLATLRTLPRVGAREFQVLTVVQPERGIPAISCKVVAMRKSPAAAERARKQAIREAKRKGRKVDPRTLESCDYIFLLTNVAQATLTATEVLEVYRLRWQIELEFKRLKSLLKIDEIRAQDPDLVKTYILSKLLGALLIEALAEFSPWGFKIASSSS